MGTTHKQASDTRATVWSRRVAWALALVTFPVLWVGGLVTTTKSGMAVPDWPNTYGYNMFLYPWQTWLFGPWDLFIEHAHRLLASVAGLLSILLAVLLWRSDAPKWLKWSGVGTVAGMVSQGVLGGQRVVLDERLLAMLHGTTGPLVFALCVAMVVWTSRTWVNALPSDNFADLRSMSLLLFVLLYLQLGLGALVRHMPVYVSPQAFSTAVKFHLLFAGVVTALTLWLALSALRGSQPRSTRRLAALLFVLVGVQLGLGVATWAMKYSVPTWAESVLGEPTTAIVADGWSQTHIATAHQANGSLLLGVSVVMLLFALRTAPRASSVEVHPTTATAPIARRATT